jgi:hypothetical protein
MVTVATISVVCLYYLVCAIKCNLEICEISVGYRRRQGGKSKISGTISGSFKAGMVILTTLSKLYLRRCQIDRNC